MKLLYRAPTLPAVGLLIVLMAGCSITQTLQDQSKIDYKSATKRPTGSLELPPDLATPRSDDRFNIPERAADRTLSAYQRGQASEKGSTDGRVLAPVAGAHLERSGTQRWLVADMPPDKLFPLIREFWQESGFVIQTELREAGILETDWAENRAKVPQDFIRDTIGKVFDNLYSTGERDKFRTRLEPGPNGTEIYISHRGMVETLTNDRRDSTSSTATIWQPRPSDPELEAEFLQRLLVKLGSEQQKPPETTAAAKGPDPAERAHLVNGDANGGGLVEISEGFDRAWRRVGLALDRGGFTVEDRDRSQGVYFVRYIDPDIEALAGGKPGFFARIFSSSDKSPASSRQYRVKVAGTGPVTQVSVQGRDGQSVSSDADRKTVVKILALLHDQLKQ
jgi:outer membrane protein assembly factor BamC